jgi:DNA-binding NarL/FixJ family response regulator
MKKILIVDDHEVLREGVKRVFDKQPGTATFGEASTSAVTISELFQHLAYRF